MALGDRGCSSVILDNKSATFDGELFIFMGTTGSLANEKPRFTSGLNRKATGNHTG